MFTELINEVRSGAILSLQTSGLLFKTSGGGGLTVEYDHTGIRRASQTSLKASELQGVKLKPLPSHAVCFELSASCHPSSMSASL